MDSGTPKTRGKDRERLVELWRLYREEVPEPDRDLVLSEEELREAQLERMNPYYSRHQNIEFVAR